MQVNTRDNWTAGVGPYFAALSRLILPPRGRVGSRANLRRTEVVAAALHQTKYPRGIGCPVNKAGARCRLCRVKVKYAESSAKA